MGFVFKIDKSTARDCLKSSSWVCIVHIILITGVNSSIVPK